MIEIIAKVKVQVESYIDEDDWEDAIGRELENKNYEVTDICSVWKHSDDDGWEELE